MRHVVRYRLLPVGFSQMRQVTAKFIELAASLANLIIRQPFLFFNSATFQRNSVKTNLIFRLSFFKHSITYAQKRQTKIRNKILVLCVLHRSLRELSKVPMSISSLKSASIEPTTSTVKCARSSCTEKVFPPGASHPLTLDALHNRVRALAARLP